MRVRSSFAFIRSDQRAVDIKISMSYLSRAAASRNIDVENPGWNDFEVEKEKARKAWNYYLSKVAIDEFQDSDHDKGRRVGQVVDILLGSVSLPCCT